MRLRIEYHGIWIIYKVFTWYGLSVFMIKPCCKTKLLDSKKNVFSNRTFLHLIVCGYCKYSFFTVITYRPSYYFPFFPNDCLATLRAGQRKMSRCVSVYLCSDKICHELFISWHRLKMCLAITLLPCLQFYADRIWLDLDGSKRMFFIYVNLDGHRFKKTISRRLSLTIQGFLYHPSKSKF